VDLGHIRYYFTAGSVLSNSHDFSTTSNTQADVFLGLDVDRAWIVKEAPTWWQPGLNTFFDSRLTSVATQSNDSASAGTAQNGGGGAGGQTSSLDTFIKSRKAASLHVGVYLPFRTGHWTVPAQDSNKSDDYYSFFLAPLAKAGFTTIIDNGNSPTSAPNTGRFFTSYTYGVRLGVFHDHKTDTGYDTNKASELVSYVDITLGRFGNFESFRDLTAERGLTATTHEFLRRRDYRYSFEGLLKIPQSIFVVGFNANIGATRYPGDRLLAGQLDRAHPYSIVHDDLRFFFGARLDFANVLQKLPQLK
jgi:hypothetical protein